MNTQPAPVAQPGTGMSDAISRWKKHLFVFRGSASRSEFWKVILWWLPAWVLVSFSTLIFWVYTITQASYPANYRPDSIWQVHEFRVWLGLVAIFASFWILFTVLNAGLGSRRLRDVGMPGWLFWACFIPPGLAVVLIFCALPPHQSSASSSPPA
ncbi:DUF805 domain-containing protein [Rothia sp. P4278]|uniref:DUF805 domain-containing protein n=1 Tax=Rothia sp. P4278 TaxID=3402658 RepID=UPI003AE40B02